GDLKAKSSANTEIDLPSRLPVAAYPSSYPLRRKSSFRKEWLYTAAAVVLLTVTLSFVFWPADTQQTPQIVRHEFESGQGEHINLKLSDGTKVTLNETSKLVIYGDFNA